MSNLFISRWSVKQEFHAEFIVSFNELYDSATDLLKAHTSAYHYGWSRNPNEFVAIEAWKNEDVVANLRKSEDFIAFFEKMMSFCDGPMKMEMINDLSNDRSVFTSYPKGKSKVHPDIGPGTVFI